MPNTPEDLSPHVSEIVRAIGARAEPEAVEDELRKYLEYGVPLAQAKASIVRNHGGRMRAGARKLADLGPGDSGVDFVAKILTVNPKSITVRGEERKIFYGLLADDTRKTAYTAWKDLKLEPGQFVRVENAYVKTFRDDLDINFGDYTNVSPTDERFEVVAGADRPSRGAPVAATVRELRDGMGSVALTGRILSLDTKTVKGKDGERTVREGVLADATGRVPFTCWGPQELAEGQVVRVENAWVRSWRGAPQLNFGDNSTVAELPADALPDASSLAADAPATVGDLAAVGGATGVVVEGVVLEVKPGSGLVFRCPQCKRVLQNRMCRVHARVEGVPDLRVKGVLDDGLASLTFFLPREPTERLLGKTLQECQDMAKEAMTTDVVFDEVARKLTARRLRVHGNATSDEFGLQLIASDGEVAPARDLKAEAEKLLDELAEVA